MDDGADDYFGEVAADANRLHETEEKLAFESESDIDADDDEVFVPPAPPPLPVKAEPASVGAAIRTSSAATSIPGPASAKEKENEMQQIDAMINSRRRYGRHNSTSTVKVEHTMAHPNNDATIEMIARRLQTMMASSDAYNEMMSRPRPLGCVDLDCFNEPTYRVASAPAYDDFSDSEDDDEDDVEEFVGLFSPGEENAARPTERRHRDSRGEIEEEKDENCIARSRGSSASPTDPARPDVDSRQPRPRGVLTEYSASEKDDLANSFRKIRLEESRTPGRRTQALRQQLPYVAKPTPSTLREYIRNMFVTAQCSEECNIICLLYVERLLECATSKEAFNPYNWRAIVMTALLLASKVWDDLSMVNEDFSIFMPYSLEQVNRWESQFLTRVQFNVRVSASQYAELYFELREQAQMAGFEGLPQKELDVAQATKLEALTATMEKRTKLLLQNLSPATTAGTPTTSSGSAGAFADNGVPAAVSRASAHDTNGGACSVVAPRHLRRSNSDAGPHRSSCRFVID